MDKAKFTRSAPGQLIPIKTPEPDWAFVPSRVPRDWALPQELVPILVDARQALARLDGAGRYMPAHSILLRPLQQREAIRSSSLEGTFATAEELLMYGLEPKPPASSTDPVNAWREVFNYDKALQRGQKLLKTLPLSSRLVRELHKDLLDEVRGSDRTPGEFRQRQVHIGADKRFVPPPAERIPDLMSDLEKYMNDGDDTTDPLVRAFLAHYQFESIHPFPDGNGRVGRLLLSLMVFRGCGLGSPWLYLSPYFDKYKDDYIDCLFRVSTHGAWDKWIELCLRGTVAETQEAMSRIDRLLALKTKYEQKLARLPRVSARLQQIVVSLLGSPIVNIPTLARRFDVTFPTAQADVTKLVSIGILKETDRKAKPQFFVAQEIFAAAYSEKE